MVGSSSPLFFTGFLQAKVIKRVIRMLKTDVNNRNETAVTDERLGQEGAQLVEMTPLPRSGSPPPLHSLFLSRPLLPPAVALGGRPGTHRSKLHWGGAAWLRSPETARGPSRAWTAAGSIPDRPRGGGQSGTRAFPGARPRPRGLAGRSVPSLAARVPSCSSPSPGHHPRRG